MCTKNYENPSIFVKVIAKKSVAPFFPGHGVDALNVLCAQIARQLRTQYVDGIKLMFNKKKRAKINFSKRYVAGLNAQLLISLFRLSVNVLNCEQTEDVI